MGFELETGRFEEEGWVRGATIGVGASGTVNVAMSRSNGQLFAVKSVLTIGGNYFQVGSLTFMLLICLYC